MVVVHELLTAHGAGCTVTFVRRGLRADHSLAASSANVLAWCSDVVRERCGRDINVIVSVNDGVLDGAFPCFAGAGLAWRQQFLSQVPDTGD